MKICKFFAILLTFVLLLGLATIVMADEPTPTPEAPPSGKGTSGPLQIQPGMVTLDPATANVIRLTLPPTGKQPSLRNLGNQQIGTTAFVLQKFEDFEGLFPNDWDISGGNQTWTDVPCFALDGFWSGWPAGLDGVGGVDPCAGNDYPNNTVSWLVYGPFSLQDATFAYFDFYYRLETEPCCDSLFRGASIDGNVFYGDFFAGEAISGPYNNGYNVSLFDLDNVPTLGNLMGEPQVWVGFLFQSDSSVTDKGAFIDNAIVGIFTSDLLKTHLPIIIKSPPPTFAKTNLYVRNETVGPASYVVKQAKFDGVVVGNKSCNIPLNQTVFCATFDAGAYQVQSNSNCPGGGGSGSRTFPPGDFNNPPIILKCK